MQVSLRFEASIVAERCPLSIEVRSLALVLFAIVGLTKLRITSPPPQNKNKSGFKREA